MLFPAGVRERKPRQLQCESAGKKHIRRNCYKPDYTHDGTLTATAALTQLSNYLPLGLTLHLHLQNFHQPDEPEDPRVDGRGA